MSIAAKFSFATDIDLFSAYRFQPQAISVWWYSINVSASDREMARFGQRLHSSVPSACSKRKTVLCKSTAPIRQAMAALLKLARFVHVDRLVQVSASVGAATKSVLQCPKLLHCRRKMGGSHAIDCTERGKDPRIVCCTDIGMG